MSASDAIIADADERARALDPTRSFIVQAPAGSGKTSLLVARYLRLLETARRPEEVLAITFTRKAAAEMRRRVLEALPARADVAHRLRIETIDAFCLSLARQLPVPAKFGVPPGIAEDARPLYREAAQRALADPACPAVARLLAHLDGHVALAVDLLAAMLARRDQWLRHAGRTPTREDLEAALARERERLIAQARALDARASVEFAREVLTAKGEWRKRAPAALAAAGNERLRAALAALLALPPERYSDAQWEALEALLAVLRLAVAELKLVFAEAGACDFTEIAQGAVRALGTPDAPTDLLLALDYRIHHVLVDEFQDTSLSQRELLVCLTAGWTPGDGRTLFLVGDPMQSIYRFRDADVGIFLRTWREGLPNVALERIRLKTNFRSQAALVAWVNETFRRVLPEREDEASGAVPFSAAAPHPANEALPGPAVQWHAPADEAEQAALVVQLVRAAEGDCALLVRNRSALAEIVPALKRAGVRFRAIEIEHLGEKQVVQDLFALARALAHPADRVAWLALARAPWCGMTLAQLGRALEGRSGTVWSLLAEVPEAARLRAALAPALEARGRASLRSRVEGAWLALGGPACVADPTELEDAEIFFDALERLERAGEADFARLSELIEELYAAPDTAAGERDLQVMTIHKAKGLEFDTVIVPGLHRGPGASEPPLMLWRERADASLLLAPIKPTGADADPLYEYLKRLEREAEQHEAGRLLYVAATRARRRLHLLACPQRTMPPRRSLLACAWEAAKPHYEGLVPPAREAPRAEQRCAPFVLKRLPPEWRIPEPPPAAAWQPRPPAQRTHEDVEFSWAGETMRQVGTVVHRWLLVIAADGLRGWNARRVAALRREFERDLARRGAQAPRAAAALVAAALRNTLADPRGRWLLGPHREALSEYRISTPCGRYAIDRVFRDADGTLWVVDFKTGRHEGADLEGFLEREMQRYAAQLDAYARALGGARRGLYFPLHAAWREYPD
ncbi:MAG: UvrD-helicase domain-containing protein [Burkholderiales bacterium]|nr:UvrD-helicase domain-containing protein [Burkholderiales bacterium]